MATDDGQANCRSKVGIYRLLLVGIAAIVLGLQIGLPVISVKVMTDVTDETIRINNGLGFGTIKRTRSRNAFWSQRFRFSQFFYPIWSADVSENEVFSTDVSDGRLISATIHGDEIIALLDYTIRNHSVSVRVNLLTGRFRYEPEPNNSRYVVANGRQVWVLPEYITFGRSSGVTVPFILNDRPVAIVTYRPNPNLFQMIEFVDGQWQKAESFPLLPARYAEIACFPVNDELHVVVFDIGHDQIMHRIGLKVGSQDQAILFDAKFAGKVEPLSETELDEIGWKQYDVPNFIPLDYRHRSP